MAQNRIKIITLLFFTVSFLDIVGIILNIDWIQFIYKPLIVLSLFTLYYYSVVTLNKWYVLALIFSFLGDVLLLGNDNLFLFGIGSFLITQLLFVKIIIDQLKKSSLNQKILAVIPFLAFYVILMYSLKENMGEFLVPVLFYGIAISVFGTVSLLNYLINKNSTADKILLLGAIIFIVSDTMIALNKFDQARIFYPAAIMITYSLSQYFILNYMKSKV